MKTGTCYGCDRRHVGCHIDCQDYAERKRKNDEILAIKAKERGLEEDICMMNRDRNRRFRRK